MTTITSKGTKGRVSVEEVRFATKLVTCVHHHAIIDKVLYKGASIGKSLDILMYLDVIDMNNTVEILKLAIEATPYVATRMKHRPRLGNYRSNILQSWFDEHLDDPYPSPDEKTWLAQKAGMDMRQVQNWFINQRKRHWNACPPSPCPPSPLCSPVAAAD